MKQFILHQYDLSPFCEKIHLAFGLKGLEWHAVGMPIWSPKPDLMPLTNGYRMAPVLQIGADVYCDTMLILREIERRQPAPSLYPNGQRGLAEVLGWWVERATFVPTAALATSVIGDQLRNSRALEVSGIAGLPRSKGQSPCKRGCASRGRMGRDSVAGTLAGRRPMRLKQPEAKPQEDLCAFDDA